MGWNGNSSGIGAEQLGRQPSEPDENRKQHRVHGLGEEQIRDALDVADHPASLADDIRQRRELVVQQHDLRDRPGGGAARPHRHTDVGVLEGQHVVDSVAGHRDRVSSRLQGMHHGPLLVGPHPAECGVFLEGVGQPIGVVGQLARIHRLALETE